MRIRREPCSLAPMLCGLATLGFGIAGWDTSAAAPPEPIAAAGEWVAAWYSPPLAPMAASGCNQVGAFHDQTVRQVVRLEAAGNRVRVRLTNELGVAPLRVGAVHVALSSPNGVTYAGTDRAATFHGRPGATIAKGAALVSDPIALEVRRFQQLAISIYFPGAATPSGHVTDVQISQPGDHAAESIWPRGTRPQAPGVVSGVEVQTASPEKVLVAFGDSITEGMCATQGTHRDYPERLAVLLAGHSGVDGAWVVINSGISGNRLLHEGWGPKALDRFGRDALAIAGVNTILLLEGINDIGAAFGVPAESGPLSAGDVIGAYQDLIRRAHARGLKVFLGTLTPYEGAGYSRPEGESVREEVNAWIRKGQGFEGVVDFDAALRDPKSPLRLLGADQCGDDLHPNDAGYQVMAEAAFQRLFAGGAPHGPVSGGSGFRPGT